MGTLVARPGCVRTKLPRFVYAHMTVRKCPYRRCGILSKRNARNGHGYWDQLYTALNTKSTFVECALLIDCIPPRERTIILDHMFLLFAAGIVVGAILLGSIAGVVVFMLLGRFGKRKARRQALLADSNQRLKAIVAELLERINSVEEARQYKPDGIDNSKLMVAISDLSMVSDCLCTIDQLVGEKRFDDANDMLARSSRVVEKVMRILNQVDSGAARFSDGSVNLKLPKSDGLYRMKSSEKK